MSHLDNSIKFVKARDSVEIHLPDQRVICGGRGLAVGKFLELLPENMDSLIVGAVVNGELRELSYPIQMDVKVKPISMLDADGALIYRRSLTFLLSAAFKKLYPDAILEVDHSMTSGAYYCQVMGRDPLTSADLISIEKLMKEWIQLDIPIQRKQVTLEEARAYFLTQRMEDKLQLLQYRKKPYLVLYQIEDYLDYHHGYMVPSAGYIRWFGLTLMGAGFALQFPRRHMGKELMSIPAPSKLLNTFSQYGNLLNRLGIQNVGALNHSIEQGKIRELILVSEALHEHQISEIANDISDRMLAIRVVLIAGPSSSGKTTFSKRLSVQLLAHGISPLPLELDNYFVDRSRTPRDENGDLDFETLDALDIAMLNDHLQRLIKGEEVRLPKYNFAEGKQEQGEVVRLQREQLLVLEGIHGLNPGLIPNISEEMTFRLYVSCLTQLNLDRCNRISTTDSRLIRRIVRDTRERGYSAQQTIQRWQSVKRGEKKHIFPYQENANEMFNSALIYELAALKPFVEPLLRQVTFGTMEYIEAKRLLAFLEWFLPIDVDLIPDNSILREFIGNSILRDFKLWTTNNGNR
jgi:uridine kinase